MNAIIEIQMRDSDADQSINILHIVGNPKIQKRRYAEIRIIQKLVRTNQQSYI